MTKAKIDEALNFLEGSPEHQELMSRIEMRFDENEDHDPDGSLAIIKMFQDLVGMEAFDEARLVSEALRREQNSMSAETTVPAGRPLAPVCRFRRGDRHLRRLEKEGKITVLWRAIR